MLQKKVLKYTPAAVDDIDEIFSYISHDNGYAAEKLENLNTKIGALVIFPT
jgi:toxin ParE1/3/4